MDRKVNTGTLAALNAAAKAVAERIRAESLGDLAPYEREIIAKVRYRKDYLADATLMQPGGSGAPTWFEAGGSPSRGGAGRSGRGGRRSH